MSRYQKDYFEEEDNEICGQCKHHKTNKSGEWVCTNQKSDNYGCETGYNDYCIGDFEPRYRI